MTHLRNRFADPLLLLFTALFFIFLIAYPTEIYLSILSFPIRTMVTLTGLIIITTAIERSNYFSSLSLKLIKGIKSERKLAFFLIALSAGLATFLTNDVALFIMIPLTLSMLRRIKNDLVKILIFEAIAVNVGSSLTPIGNPQNLYIWHRYNVSFLNFIIAMLIPTVISFFILLIFVVITVPKRDVEGIDMSAEKTNKKLFIFSMLSLIVFVISLHYNVEFYALILIAIIFLISPATARKVDWVLLFVFLLIFIDFGTIPFLLSHFSLPPNPSTVYLISAGLSQLISNVPATVVLAPGTSKWEALAWGVNVGGNGTIVASIANIIALRLSKRKIGAIFHVYSFLFFIFTVVIMYFILLFLH